MTRFRIVASVSILSLTLGACVFAYGQDGQDKNKDKPQNKDKHASPGNQPQPQARPAWAAELAPAKTGQ